MCANKPVNEIGKKVFELKSSHIEIGCQMTLKLFK